MLREISSKEHPLVKYLTKLRLNRDFRHENKRVIVEGEKLVVDLAAKKPYHHLLVSEKTALPEQVDATHVIQVSDEVMRKVSGFQTPPGLVAEMDMPDPSSLKGLKWVLALEGIQDPGNLGTLIRTALGLGWQGVFLLDATCDLFNEKVLRASQGASFLLPYETGTLEDLKQLDLPCYVADMKGKKPKGALDQACLILGNEGQGISASLKKAFPAVSLAMSREVESLNVAVAGGILMYLLRGELCPE